MWKGHRFILATVLALSISLIGLYESGLAAPSGRAQGEATAAQTQPVRQRVRNRGNAERRPTATRPTTRPASRPVSSRPAEGAGVEVVAYYFHRTLRCPSCLHIEASAKKVIQERFAPALETGLLHWEAVDFQKKGNEHFATDYKLEAPSLVLVRKIDGRQESWKNCEKVWDLHRNEPAFAEYVQGELDGMLAGPVATTRPASSNDKAISHRVDRTK